MSLASFESALLQLVVDALEDCGETPSPVARHHGHALPSCCPEDGAVSAWWGPGETPDACAGPFPWTVFVHWSMCWPREEAPPSGPVPIDSAARDAVSARLADVAECVQAALARTVCDWAESPLREHAVEARLAAVTPTGPDGPCAGVTWRLAVKIRRPASGAS